MTAELFPIRAYDGTPERWCDLEKEATEIKWIVEGLIPQGCQMIVAGPPKTWKTWLVMYLAKRVSCGEPFFKMKTFRRNVLYTFLEDGRDRTCRRIRNIGVFEQGNALIDGALGANFYRAGFERALDIVRRSGPMLWVVDPLIRLIADGGFDENSTTDMSRFFAQYRELLHDIGTTLLLIHHFRKARDMFRGASSIESEADGVINLEEGAGEHGQLLLSWKPRDADDGQIGILASVRSGLVSLIENDPPERKVASNGTNGQKTSESDKLSDRELLSLVEEYIAGCKTGITQEALGKLFRVRKSKIGELVTKLKDEGKVTEGHNRKTCPTDSLIELLRRRQIIDNGAVPESGTAA